MTESSLEDIIATALTAEELEDIGQSFSGAGSMAFHEGPWRYCVETARKLLREVYRLRAAGVVPAEPATCPHVVTSAEGTSYCTLAETAGVPPEPASQWPTHCDLCGSKLNHIGPEPNRWACEPCGRIMSFPVVPAEPATHDTPFVGKAKTMPSTLYMDGTSPVTVLIQATTDELRQLHNRTVTLVAVAAVAGEAPAT